MAPENKNARRLQSPSITGALSAIQGAGIGHVSPEAYWGGPIALMQEEDLIFPGERSI